MMDTDSSKSAASRTCCQLKVWCVAAVALSSLSVALCAFTWYRSVFDVETRLHLVQARLDAVPDWLEQQLQVRSDEMMRAADHHVRTVRQVAPAAADAAAAAAAAECACPPGRTTNPKTHI